MRKSCPVGVKTLRKALQFAVANLEEVALPRLKKAGAVSSVPSAIKKAKAALRQTRHLCP